MRINQPEPQGYLMPDVSLQQRIERLEERIAKLEEQFDETLDIIRDIVTKLESRRP
jgi:hypothetical protein